MSSIGFDIGNENSYVAAVRSGGIEILDNEYSLRATPTYIAFTERSREVGIGAKVKLVTNLEHTVFGFKRILGKRYGDSTVEKEFEYLPHKAAQLPYGEIGIKVKYLKNDVIYSITQLMAMMLTKLKMITENKLSGQIRDCVISVPVYYTDAQRRAMLDAAEIANLNPLRLMNESIAIALAYGYYKLDLSEQQAQNVIFIDMGNSSITVTACAFYEGKIKVLASVWDDVGGRDFDNILVKHFVFDFMDKYKLDVMSSEKALMTLMLECESLKRLMSANSLELGIQIECFMNDLDVKGRMKRELFENLSSVILSRVEKILRNILEETKLTVNDIHSVEIIGGSCRIPAVKLLIHKIFGREANSTLNQDEAVARGCALQGALLSPSLKTRHFVIEDVPTFDIKVMWKNMESKHEELDVFSRSDKIPASKMITFCMSEPFTLEVFQTGRVTQERIKIGNFMIGKIPVNVENRFTQVKIKVCLDINGIFSITSAKMNIRSIQTEENKVVLYKEQHMGIFLEGENIDSTDKIAQSNISDSSVQSYELSVTADVPGLSQEHLDEFIETERTMIHRYIMEKERADARNALEEYIYDARSKLNNEFNDYVVANDKIKLFEFLYETEDWLYDNEGQKFADYSNKLTESKMHFDPIFKRRREWEQLPGLVDEYHHALQLSLDLIGKIADMDQINAYQGKVESLQKMYCDAKKFLDQSVTSLSNVKKCEDVSMTFEGMRKTLDQFQYDFQGAYYDLKRNLETSCESGYGHSTKEENSASGSGTTSEV